MPTRIERAIEKLARAVKAIPERRNQQAVIQALGELRSAVNAEAGKIAAVLNVPPWTVPPWTDNRGRPARRR